MRWLLLVAGIALASAQFGFFDLQNDDATKFHGTTGDVLPNCFSTPNGVCGNGGRTIFAPDAHQEHLVSWYTFDDAFGLDHAGVNALHALNKPEKFAPGIDGRGQSLWLQSDSGFQLPHSDLYSEGEQTISFWMYLLEDSTDSWRVVVRKGDKVADLTPTILLFPDTRKLHVRVSSSDDSHTSVDSVAIIPLRRWTHVAVSMRFPLIEIYINGVLDSRAILNGEIQRNSGSWYLGKDPFLPGTTMFLDNFKVFNKALEEKDLQVEASSALPGLGPNFVRLGCASCTMKNAIENCAATGGYHLCRNIELQGGALMVARAMGYYGMASEHWAAEDAEPDISLEKLGLCCQD